MIWELFWPDVSVVFLRLLFYEKRRDNRLLYSLTNREQSTGSQVVISFDDTANYSKNHYI